MKSPFLKPIQWIRCQRLLWLALIILTMVSSLIPTIALTDEWRDEHFPINRGLWPTLHHDMHNSDHMNETIGNFSSMTGLTEMAWLLREEGHPSVILTVAAMGDIDGKEMLFITTGKTEYPNLHAFDMEDGSEIWHAAPSTAIDPGPGACAMSSMALLDETGRLYISDCHYLFCFDAAATPNGDGTLPYLWRRPMPGLRSYSDTDGLWHLATDPTVPQTRAKPFITLFFTRKVEKKSYIGGISTEGGVYLFDPDDGTLFAETFLDSGAGAEAADWTPESGPCDVATYVAEDDPMVYDIAPGSDDDLTPFGIWCTGVRPETDDPDADYFMDPCQLSGYFNANTVGGGGMVINTPSVALDPDRPTVSRIYVNGSQTPTLSASDLTPAAEDAFVYRIDFDPTAPEGDRLTLLNHERERGGRYQYNGRMVNGENSLSSPTLSPNEKWIITGDNQGKLYTFSAEDGSLIWMEEIGSLLGSPTVVQRTEADGLFYIHTFGDSSLWSFACDPDSGAIVKQSRVDFRQYILRNYWRGDDPGYARHFLNASGHAYERAAVGASIAVATDDKMVLVYTVGWHDPDRPAPYLIPTHSVILTVHRLSLFSEIPSDAMIDNALIDTHGTMEQATLIAPGENGLRFLIPHGSQSTTFARFLEVNDKMPDAMKSLYMKPYGGVRLAAPIFAETPTLTPDLPSGQTVGTPIRWEARYPGNGSIDYRFRVSRTADASLSSSSSSLSSTSSTKAADQGPSGDASFRASEIFSRASQKGLKAISDEMRLLTDFNPSPVAIWTPMETGTHTIEVTFRDRERLEELGRHTVTFQVASPIPAEQSAAVTPSSHPLVPIVSCGSCPAGARMRVDFQEMTTLSERKNVPEMTRLPDNSETLQGDALISLEASSAAHWQSTGYVPCSPDGLGHLYVAGLRSQTAYGMRPVVVKEGIEHFPLSNQVLTYTSDAVGITFPDVLPLIPPFDPADDKDDGVNGEMNDTDATDGGGGDDDSDDIEPFLFMAGFPASPSNPLPMAVDLSGSPVWYYPRYQDESVVATAPTPEGTYLLITADDTLQGQRLREIDLAGQIVREVTVDRINEQLTNLGHDHGGAFDHEAVRFPDGNTLVQLSVERVVPGIQTGSDTILGSMIVALNRDFQVVWAWNSFDHLDLHREAILGEMCRYSDDATFPGCPPLFTASKAADWIHGNHIAPSPVDGHLIYSLRNQDWVVKIDYNGGTGTGAVIWKLGAEADFTLTSTSSGSGAHMDASSDFSSADTDADSTYHTASVSSDSSSGLMSDQWFSHQHGATYVSENQILIFDNGNTRCASADDPEGCHSRGRLYTLNEMEKTATLTLDADLGLYSMALGNAQRLSMGTFTFTAGLLTDDNSPTGQVVEVGSAGEKRSLFQAEMNIYRSYRMKNLYAASWDGFSRCSARLFSDLTLKIPILDLGSGLFIDVDLVWDSRYDDIRFLMTDFSEIDHHPDYAACDTAYLTWDGMQYLATLPSLAFQLDGYRVTMALVIVEDGTIWFRLDEIKGM